MTTALNINDPIIAQALNAIDAGDAAALATFISQHPQIVQHRVHNRKEGYFKDPYLLWFMANNPIRTDKQPFNLIDITRQLINAVKLYADESYQLQVDYALALVASGSKLRDKGMQIAMMDVLIDAGASPDCAMTAITNGNLGAAQHLVDRGCPLTFTVALLLERTDSLDEMFADTDNSAKLTALNAAAYYGNAAMVQYLLNRDVTPNGFPDEGSGFHAHATALHQAVSSGNLPCVKLLIDAGADINVRDKNYHGTPAQWASYLRRDSIDEAQQHNFALIENYLRG